MARRRRDKQNPDQLALDIDFLFGAPGEHPPADEDERNDRAPAGEAPAGPDRGGQGLVAGEDGSGAGADPVAGPRREVARPAVVDEQRLPHPNNDGCAHCTNRATLQLTLTTGEQITVCRPPAAQYPRAEAAPDGFDPAAKEDRRFADAAGRPGGSAEPVASTTQGGDDREPVRPA